MSIEIKYKLGDLAKDLGAASKDIIEMLSALEKGEAKKHTTPLAEKSSSLEISFPFTQEIPGYIFSAKAAFP